MNSTSSALWDPTPGLKGMKQIGSTEGTLDAREGSIEIDAENGRASGENKVALNVMEEDIKKQIMTHGYIHGHIHKHKNHTHIHGHIHNHDHHKAIEVCDGYMGDKSYEDDCKEIDDLSLCNGILCEELDDCFYSNCGDSTVDGDHYLQETSSYSAPQSYSLLDSKSGTSGYAEYGTSDNSTDGSNFVLDDYRECHEVTKHENNLCDFQAFKRPLFEDLINNVHSNLDVMKETGTAKKRRVSNTKNFKIHFPHKCNDIQSDDTSDAIPQNHHDFHQSCFHTTIPDANSSSNIESREYMSDFDFYVQFNNFNDYLLSLEKSNEEKDYESLNQKIEYLNNDEQPNNFDIDVPSYYCRWDNCMRKVSDDSFMQHVVEQHIKSEYGFGIKDNRSSQFQCEWTDCGFTNKKLDNLINHINDHKDAIDKLSDDPKISNTTLITPNLTPKSFVSSPKAKKSEDEAINGLDNNVRITDMKIMPKRKGIQAQTSEDSKFVCHWQVGLDASGNPIHCNKQHDTNGELQNHLIDEHIGAGKSSYYCFWIGCERHNGKVFTQRQKLLRHLHIHTNFKPCKCDICGASFAVTAMLKQHMRVHSGEKPFSCKICDKKFATSSSLSIHNRVHSGERPLICNWPGCDKRFSESSNLRKHMKTHTRRYKCEECGAEFCKKPDFKRHIKLHEVVQSKI